MGSHFDKMVEGYCEVPGGKIWYGVCNSELPSDLPSELSSDQIPLICIHGGPGYTYNSFTPLAKLERKVVFYDQLGCGKSDRPSDSSLWTIERHVEELKSLIKHLGFEQVYLLGHSWGTIVALEYAVKYPKKLEAVVFASSCISVPKWIEDSKRLIKDLKKEDQRAIKIGNQLGEYHSKDYQKASNEYYKKFICRAEPKPKELILSDKLSGPEVYLHMWGPNEFTLLGSLKDYDGSKKLKSVNIPVLVTCGRYDEGTPESSEYYASILSNSTLSVIEDCAHFPHVEQKNEYLKVLNTFLNDCDLGQELTKKPYLAFALLLAVAFSLLILMYVFIN